MIVRSLSISDREEDKISTDENGFFSIDAFFAILLLIMVATSLITASQRKNRAAQETSKVFMKDMTAEKLAGIINTVYANGSGLRRKENNYFGVTISLSENILGENYTISLSENRTIIVENSKAGLEEPIGKASIAPNNVDNFVLHPENLSSKIRIFWDNNIVEVESC